MGGGPAERVWRKALAGSSLPGEASCLSKQAEEGGASVWSSGKLGHVADALGEGDGDGPASKQGGKPLRRLPARGVSVEGEEDAGAAPQRCGDALQALCAEGGAGGDAPLRQRKPVEDPFRDDRPGRRVAETPKSKHRLGARQCLEAGRPVGVYGPTDEPADESAGDIGNDYHPGESLPSTFHEQPAVPEPVGGEAAGLKGLPLPAARGVAEAQAGCGGLADAP